MPEFCSYIKHKNKSWQIWFLQPEGFMASCALPDSHAIDQNNMPYPWQHATKHSCVRLWGTCLVCVHCWTEWCQTAFKEAAAGAKRRSTLMVSPLQIQKTSSKAKKRSWNLRKASVFAKYAQNLWWRISYPTCLRSHVLKAHPLQGCWSPRDRLVSQHLQTTQSPAVWHPTWFASRCWQPWWWGLQG